MFAVIQTGGKQIKVSKGMRIVVEKLLRSAGDSIDFHDVLMVADEESIQIGAPFLQGVTVVGELVEQTRGDKLIVFKKNRRHNYRRKNGHRQELSVVKISEILLKGERSVVEKKSATPDKEKSATPDKGGALGGEKETELKAVRATSQKAKGKKFKGEVNGGVS